MRTVVDGYCHVRRLKKGRAGGVLEAGIGIWKWYVILSLNLPKFVHTLSIRASQ